MKTLKRLVAIAFSAFIVMPLAGQDFRRVFEDFSASAKQVQENFADSINAEFSKTISFNWEEFEICDADSTLQQPQPDTPPIAKTNGKSTGVISVLETVDTFDVTFSTDRSSVFSTPVGQSRLVEFPFYGTVQTVSVPARYGSFHPAGISEVDVGDFWNKLGKEDYSHIIEKCADNRNRYGYNDWAVLEWVRALSCALFPDNIHSERTIFEVFILNQMGLMVKLARVNDRLEGLFSSLQPVFARKYTIIDTYKYYMTDAQASVSELFTYRSDFSGKMRPLDLRINKPLDLGLRESFSLQQFNSTVFDCSLEIPVNEAMIRFYGTYPQTTINVYAQSVPNGRFSGHLLAQLKNRLSGFDCLGAVNELLRFLQYDFRYENDIEQFGREKQFFCEENFVYGANDCEDRAVLFSYLVRQLTGQKVVLLEYDDHIATAVCLNVELKGHYVKMADGRYYICDPTYIGASAGMCIQEYADKQARVYIL